jgi:hypothetical protein
VLLPVELNKQTEREVPDVENLPAFDEDRFIHIYAPEDFASETITDGPPIAFIAPRNTTRMQSQLSVFTIHHRDNTPIEEIGDARHIFDLLEYNRLSIQGTNDAGSIREIVRIISKFCEIDNILVK